MRKLQVILKEEEIKSVHMRQIDEIKENEPTERKKNCTEFFWCTFREQYLSGMKPNFLARLTGMSLNLGRRRST